MKQYLAMLIQQMPRRQTSKQKDNFLKITSALLKEKSVPTHVVEIQEKRIKAKFLVAGSKEASIVFLCPYDTGKRMLVPHGIFYPGNDFKNHHIEELNLILYFLLCVIGMLCIFLSGFLYRRMFYFGSVILVLLAILLLYISIRTPSPKVNMNRSNAACGLAYELVCKESDTVAVIFCDVSVETGAGYYLLQKKYSGELKKRTLIFLDALADGEKLYVLSNSPSFKTFASKMHASFQLCKTSALLSSFSNACFLVSGECKDGNLIVPNSRNNKDCHIHMDRLEQVLENLLSFIDSAS